MSPPVDPILDEVRRVARETSRGYGTPQPLRPPVPYSTWVVWAMSAFLLLGGGPLLAAWLGY